MTPTVQSDALQSVPQSVSQSRGDKPELFVLGECCRTRPVHSGLLALVGGDGSNDSHVVVTCGEDTELFRHKADSQVDIGSTNTVA